jgi:hypothetical protein
VSRRSCTPHIKSYHIHLWANSSLIYVLTIAHRPPLEPTFWQPNLAVLAKIYTRVSSQTSIPLPTFHALDTTLSIVPYHYILLSYPSGLKTLTEARKDGALSKSDGLRLDLQLGVYLRQLHDIQNDWFGIPGTQEPIDPSYNWQESFTLLLEEALHKVETEQKIELEYEELRGYLSRAIGFYVFDDVQVPSLVWNWGNEDGVLVSTSVSSDPEIKVVQLKPTQAVWGDPLLEPFFFPSGPSSTVTEGYGKQLIVFPRQKTKRIWYNILLALTTLVQGGMDKREWAMEVLEKCKAELKEAPCYYLDEPR